VLSIFGKGDFKPVLPGGTYVTAFDPAVNGLVKLAGPFKNGARAAKLVDKVATAAKAANPALTAFGTAYYAGFDPGMYGKAA
jgi:hypothetical protein